MIDLSTPNFLQILTNAKNTVPLCSDACVHHQADVVTLQKNAADSPPSLLLHLNLFGIVDDKVHVLVEAQNSSFNSQVGLLVEPDLNARPVLQVAKDLIDRQGHDLLQLLVANRHGCYKTK